jgi:uncharacterized protein Yka (UPF0111/DUF47 family)
MARNLAIVLPFLLLISSCESAYYDAMEKVGVHKREMLIDRIEEAQESQEEGQEQFKNALEQFRSVINVDGGELENIYTRLNDEYETSVDAAETIHDRIDDVESVADALFDEWRDELAQYNNPALRRDSERQLRKTQRLYARLMTAMHRTEKTIEPVLARLQDNVLYLKHNLNSHAIASLKGELATVDQNIASLVAAMQQAINESNQFIEALRASAD